MPSHQITFVEIGVDVDKIGGEIVDVRAANRLGGAKDVLPTGADVGVIGLRVPSAGRFTRCQIMSPGER